MTTKKWVYLFSSELTEGNKDMKDLLGGKGANLAEMCSLKLHVPPGFTVTTEACLDYEKAGKQINAEVREQVLKAITEAEKLTGKKFGDNSNPLLFSVRSGARASMPGMMDTVLNLGMNDQSVLGLDLPGIRTDVSFRCMPTLLWISMYLFLNQHSRI